MLLFNNQRILFSRIHIRISKHPMLLFNKKHERGKGADGHISKHPMLLFNRFAGNLDIGTRIFQNILCYCLTVSCPAM